LRFTTTGGDAERIAADACRQPASERPRLIVACGGDGTVQEVATALAQAACEGETVPLMGLAPAGRCNDFARALNVPSDPQRIAAVLMKGDAAPVDLGRIGTRCFCTVATLGVDAEVSRFVDTMRMPLRGTPAYVYGAIRVLMRYRPCRVRLEGDFGVLEQAVFLASTANTPCYGGAIRIVPHADPTDGRLDLCLIDPLSRLRSLLLLPAVLRATHPALPEVKFVQTRGFRIETDKPAEIWADGERIGSTPATVEVIPGAIRVLHPTPANRGDTSVEAKPGAAVR
ncbi:MAG: diacylglycerol kinase family lipid kinase, partial [Planctomycetota bacterium]